MSESVPESEEFPQSNQRSNGSYRLSHPSQFLSREAKRHQKFKMPPISGSPPVMREPLRDGSSSDYVKRLHVASYYQWVCHQWNTANASNVIETFEDGLNVERRNFEHKRLIGDVLALKLPEYYRKNTLSQVNLKDFAKMKSITDEISAMPEFAPYAKHTFHGWAIRKLIEQRMEDASRKYRSNKPKKSPRETESSPPVVNGEETAENIAQARDDSGTESQRELETSERAAAAFESASRIRETRRSVPDLTRDYDELPYDETINVESERAAIQEEYERRMASVSARARRRQPPMLQNPNENDIVRCRSTPAMQRSSADHENNVHAPFQSPSTRKRRFNRTSSTPLKPTTNRKKKRRQD